MPRAYLRLPSDCETGTAARLRIAGKRLHVEVRHVDATIEAFHFLQLLRLRQQDLPERKARPNRIDPDELNEVDQRMLKEAFRQATQLQQRLRFPISSERGLLKCACAMNPLERTLDFLLGGPKVGGADEHRLTGGGALGTPT